MIRRFFLFCAGVSLLSTSIGWAQDSRGTIVGRVTDATGAVIPAASVEVTNKAMGTKTAITSNEIGFYQAPFLIPGRYQVTVETKGFKKAVRDNIEVRVNDQIELNFSLEVGTAEQSITVSGETPLLNTTSASMGTVVDTRRIAEMPIPHGNPYFLIALATGVAFTRDPRLDRPFEPTHIVGYSMDGTRANRSDVTMDGAVSTATANAGEVIASYVPPADIIAEFKVQTATFDASFGNTEGGVTNISLKSGTNALHGTAYWVRMPQRLLANDYFGNATGTPLAKFGYNRWGGSLGGPLVIPKIYNGKNKTFVMWGYEGIHDSRPRNNGTPTVPTTAMKSGNFAQLLAIPGTGASYQIYNPFTRRAIAGGRFQADPFAGNIIPASMINPIAANILKYFPEPKSAGNADGTTNYQRPEMVERAKYYTHSVRVDHNISDKQRVFGRVSVYRRDSDYNNFFDNLATGTVFQFLSRAAVFDDVYTLSPTTILNVRYGYNRFIRGDSPNPASRGFDLTSLGFPASYNNSIGELVRSFPRIEISGYQATGFGADFRPIDTHEIVASVQKSVGSHFVKTGMEMRAYRENSRPTANTQTGQFNFDSNWTKGPLDNSTAAPGSIGQSVASLLLGLPATSSFVAIPASYAEQSLSWGFFVHDDWKITRRLTLNLGVRWEFENPMTERFNRSIRGFDAGYIQPFETQARTVYANNPTPEVPPAQFNSRGGLTFAGVNGQPNGLYSTPKVNLMPRFGIAYQLNDKTVLRTGYGIFFGFLGQRRGDVILSGFSRNTPIVSATTDSVNFKQVLNDPFPNGLLAPVGAGQGPQTLVGNSITYFDESPVMPYMQRWQMGLQRQLGSGFVMEASYVGNRGNRVEIGQNLNATPQQYLSTLPTRDQTRINYLSTNFPNPFVGILPTGASGTFTGANLSRERLMRAYPEFDAVNHARFDGYSWYHSFQISMEKRFSKGYTIQWNYTFSKYMQASETLNTDDRRPYETISDLDRPHRFVMSSLYEFPFGKGRHFGANVTPVLSKIISGWQVAGVYSFQSGAPLGWGNILMYADINKVKLDNKSTSQWFNTNAGFEKATANQLGSNVRTFPQRFGFLRGDIGNNVDFSIVKNTSIAEGKDIQFKAESLNAFNHPTFPAPNTTPTAAQFGQIQASNQANYARRFQLSLKFLF